MGASRETSSRRLVPFDFLAGRIAVAGCIRMGHLETGPLNFTLAVSALIRHLAYTSASPWTIPSRLTRCRVAEELRLQSVKTLFVELNKRLRPFGFRRRGQTFARQSDECWQVISVQLSRYSQQDEKTLTVNFGVQSKSVLRFRGRGTLTPPLYYTCPINFRIGWLMPGDDIWWTVRDDASAHAALAEIGEVLRSKALPFLGQLQTDRNILELYETGLVLGFEIERDESRLLLLAKAGMSDEVKKRLEEYRAHWPKTGATERASKFLRDFESIKS